MIPPPVEPEVIPRQRLASIAPRLMATSPTYWATKVMLGPPEPPYNGHFIAGRHHLEWDRLVTGHDRVCVLASRGLGKTFFFSEAYPIWRAIYRPGKLTFILSATRAQAEEVLEHIKKEVEENPELQWLLPARKTVWNKSQIKFSNGSRIVTAGFGVRKRGLHPDCILVDDGLTDEVIYSPTVRRKSSNYFFTAITNMINPGGIIVVVGTPLAANDLYGELRKNAKYKFCVFPAIDKDNNLLFPERFSRKFLDDKLTEIGAMRFGQEIRCVPMSDEASLFPNVLFQNGQAECRSLTLGMPQEFWANAGIDLYMGVDFALSSATGADYFVIFVVGVDSQGNRYWVDIFRAKGMAYQTQLSTINTYARKYEVNLAVLEANQAQRIFGDELIDQTDLPIKKYTTGVEKHHLAKGIPSLRTLLENRKIRIPRGDKRSVEMTDIVIDEFHGWTYVDGRVEHTGDHDDTNMACLAPGALVTTKTGNMPIENIAVGDIVLTHRGRWQRVTHTMRRRHSGVARVIKARGRAAFIITPEHPIYRTKGKEIAPRNILVPDDSNWQFVPADRLMAGRKKLGDYALVPIPKWNRRRARLDLAQFVVFSKSPKGGNCWKKDGKHVWWRADRKIPRYLIVDERLAFVIGLFLAEGSTGGGGRIDKKGIRTARHCVSFGLHENETYLIDMICEVFLQKFSANCHVLPCKTSKGVQVAALSVPAAALFARCGKSWLKAIPDEWMGWPLGLRKWLLRGWLCGDGSMQRRKNGEGDYLRAVSISAKLIDQMRWTAQHMGLAPAVGQFRANTRKKTIAGRELPPGRIASTLVFSSLDTRKLLNGMMPEEARRWASAVLTSRQTKANTGTVFVPKGVAVRIAMAQDIQYEGDVYNMQVEEDESYVVEGIAVHNCWLADIAIKSGGFRATFGDEYKKHMEKGVLRAKDVPEEPVFAQPVLPPSDAEEVEYDMFGNPILLDGDVVGPERVG